VYGSVCYINSFAMLI